MGRIQSSVGLVTGVAIEDTVNQLMQLNAIPRDRLANRNTGLQQEQVALTELTALVVGVQLSTDRLGQASLYTATKVNSGNAEVLAARSVGAPRTGSYSFIPVQQAQSQQLTSSLFASRDQTLSDGEIVLHTGGFLDESVNLDLFNAGAGVARGNIRITDRSGNRQVIDLRFAQTAQDVVDKINANDELGVIASLQGDHFVLNDVSGGTTSELNVEELNGGTTARDLGLAGISTAGNQATGSSVYSLSSRTPISTLRDGRGLDLLQGKDLLRFQLRDGTQLNVQSALNPNSASLGQLLEEINQQAGGKLQARINQSANAIEVEDLTSGSQAFVVSSPTGQLAEQLGIVAPANEGVIQGAALISGLGDVLLNSLQGGRGLGSLGDLEIVDRSGNSATLNLATAKSLRQVIDTINAAGVGVQAQLNRTKTGIEIVDTSGATTGNLQISSSDGSDTAAKLKIQVNAAVAQVDSGSLERQFVHRNTLLSRLNKGQDFPLGSIRLIDSSGAESAVNLASSAAQTVGDVLDAINGLGIGIRAQLNQAGDGILIVDTAEGPGEMSISDVGSGQAAAQLGIAGKSSTLTSGGATIQGINGSRTLRLSTDSSTSIADLVEQLNQLGGSPVNASLLSLGASGGVRVLLSGARSGGDNRIAIDSPNGISFSETSRGRDALLAFGANENSGGVLVASSTNTFRELVQDVEFTVNGISHSPISVSVTENSETLTKQIETVVSQFNKLREKLSDLTSFDAATNSVGVLFGSNAALRIDLNYGRLFSGAFRGAGSINSLGQLGIRLNDTGKLEFDQDKFAARLAQDPSAVQEFFTNESSGFAAKAKSVADGLAGIESGALLSRSNALQTQIEQNVNRLGAFDIRLDKQRTRLLTQFYNMETAIAKLQTNLTALNQLQIIPPLGSRN